MRITTRGRYALRALLALARIQNLPPAARPADINAAPPISVHQISVEEYISPVFLEQIFFKLRKAGLVQSLKGPHGGFKFVKSPDKITLKEIFAAAGEELDITECDKNAKTCKITGKRCVSHGVWEDISKILDNYLCKTTLAAVMAQHNRNLSH
jgi:Rrf2 family iron-sulfur cluster assembly transcriptional regulator